MASERLEMASYSDDNGCDSSTSENVCCPVIKKESFNMNERIPTKDVNASLDSNESSQVNVVSPIIVDCYSMDYHMAKSPRKRKVESDETISVKRRKGDSYPSVPSETMTNLSSTNNASEVDCVICLDTMESQELQYLPCCHRFHAQCIGRWTARKNICPICKTGIYDNEDDCEIREKGADETEYNDDEVEEEYDEYAEDEGEECVYNESENERDDDDDDDVDDEDELEREHDDDFWSVFETESEGDDDDDCWNDSETESEGEEEEEEDDDDDDDDDDCWNDFETENEWDYDDDNYWNIFETEEQYL